ncbi:MFS general substrate transporter [Westerdykella ornata]|uniref:MFS general substrate transporter n=1 Tax=Westerdykella ornata TaxID=318751 RepID=A0A6A6JI82_WESOR|nr:MFS general substrate transporter [Westerdykella ornata]KAF2275793.1 MFS general substrate transporter [Westerdykella ornata]
MSHDTISKRELHSTTDIEPLKPQPGPEGGAQAWLTLAGSFLVNYSTFGLINSFGFFQNYYQNYAFHNVPPSTIAFIGTLQIMLTNILGAISGALCDSYNVKYLYTASGLGLVSSMIVLSYINHGPLWQAFLVQGLFMGLSIAFGAQPALVAAGQHFKQRRAFAMAIVIGGCALGGVCFPLMLSQLVPKVGFSWSLRLASFKVAMCYSTAIAISTSKHARKPLRGIFHSLVDFGGFQDRRYLVLAIGAWFANVGIWIPNYYIETYCMIIDPTAPIKGYLLPLINGTSILGMILGGLMGDQIGRLNVLYHMALILGLLCTMWALSSTVTILVAFAILFGFFSGAYVALVPSAVGQISPDEKLGGRIGAFYSLVAFSSVVGTPVGGLLITDHTKGGYQGVILYAGATLSLGGVLMLASRLLHDTSLRARW